jgi:hypothetical protein
MTKRTGLLETPIPFNAAAILSASGAYWSSTMTMPSSPTDAAMFPPEPYIAPFEQFATREVHSILWVLGMEYTVIRSYRLTIFAATNVRKTIRPSWACSAATKVILSGA